MRNKKNILAIIVMFFLAVGCATLDAGRGKPVTLAPPSGKDMGMIVGRIDDSESKHKVTYITIWDLKTRARGGNEGIPVRMFPDGTFVAVNVKPGKYFIPMLTSKKTVAGIIGGEPYKPFEVKAGKVTYWGSYKTIFKKGSNLLGIPPRVSLKASGKKEKKKVFAQILKAAKGSRWEKIVKRSM